MANPRPLKTKLGGGEASRRKTTLPERKPAAPEAHKTTPAAVRPVTENGKPQGGLLQRVMYGAAE